MSPKQQILTAFAGIARALGNAHRLDLLDLLAQGDRDVDTLATKAGLSVANTSQHLQALRRAGLVEATRRGKQIFYHLAGDDVLDAIAALRAVGERRAASVRDVVTGYFERRDQFDPVTFDELTAKLADGLITLIDVRPPDEFVAGHLPGAVNVPLAALKKRHASLPKREIVAYCRGPWCVLAFEAVALLRRSGRAARRLDGGLPEWRRAGRDVIESGAP